MDLGSGVCTPARPRCLRCPLRADCAGHATGAPEDFPAPKAKSAKPQRFGTIFWAQAGDRVLLVRRPDTGLLGGMRALPTGPWADVAPDLADAPLVADWRLLDERVAHGFTHFHLELALAVARVAAHQDGEWWPVDRLGEAGLPTVFAKAAKEIGRVECA